MLNVAAARASGTCSSAGALPRSCCAAPADHRHAGGADRVSLRDQPARGVDAALALRAGLALHPVTRPLAGRRLADDLGADGAHHGEAVVHLGHVRRRPAGGPPSRTLCSSRAAPRPGGARRALPSSAGRSPAPYPASSTASALATPSRREALPGRENQRRVPVGDLRAVVGLQRQAVHHVAVDALDRHRLVDRDLHLLHLRARVVLSRSRTPGPRSAPGRVRSRPTRFM